MRSPGRAGATVMAPAGEAIPARDSSQPASKVSASGTGAANRPATPSTSKPSASCAPAPPCSSGTQASVSPASASVRQSGAFQPSSLARLMVWGSARSAKIRVAVSATIVSALAHDVSRSHAQVPGGSCHCCRAIVVGSPGIGKRQQCAARGTHAYPARARSY